MDFAQTKLGCKDCQHKIDLFVFLCIWGRILARPQTPTPDPERQNVTDLAIYIRVKTEIWPHDEPCDMMGGRSWGTGGRCYSRALAWSPSVHYFVAKSVLLQSFQRISFQR